jgi:nitric oxide reductase NorD protein
MAAQHDKAQADRWADGVHALLYANAGIACLAALLRLRGAAAELADAAHAVTDICRHAGATPAIACMDAWDRLRAPGLWSGWVHLAGEAPDCVATAAASAGSILQAVGSDGFAGFVALGLRGTGRDKTRRTSFFALSDPLARQALAQGTGGGLALHERGLKLLATALLGWVPSLRPLPATPGRPTARRASLSDGVVLLPEAFPGVPPAAQAPLYRATVAHAVAHLMAGTPRQPVGKLKPLQLALIGLIEDARVEALALRRFPGLRRLWAPYHVARPEGDTAPALLARLARALFDPDYEDPHGFVGKGAALFAAADLLDTGAPRRIGGLLGNDLGQMRVQFNARTHVVEPAYRDDGLGMWDFPDQAETPPELLEMMVEAARLRQEAGEGRGEGEPDPGSAPARARPVAAEPGGVLLARYPEWDRAQGEERPEWTSVFEIPAAAGDGPGTGKSWVAGPDPRAKPGQDTGAQGRYDTGPRNGDPAGGVQRCEVDSFGMPSIGHSWVPTVGRVSDSTISRVASGSAIHFA